MQVQIVKNYILHSNYFNFILDDALNYLKYMETERTDQE